MNGNEEWEVLPAEIKARILNKNCFGDHEKIDGMKCGGSCPLYNECLKASLRQLLAVYDAIHTMHY